MGLIEAHYNKFQTEGLVLYFKDTHQIYVVWHTRDIITSSVSIYSLNFGVGDHHPCIVDLQVKSVLGTPALPLFSDDKKRLTCSTPVVVQRHIAKVEAQFKLHQLPRKTQELIDQ